VQPVSVDLRVLLTILGMAAVTYATRAAGPWLMDRLPNSPRLEAGLRQMPGAIMAAIVVPAAIAAGLVGALGAVMAMAIMARTRSLPLAMVVAVAFAAIWRAWA